MEFKLFLESGELESIVNSLKQQYPVEDLFAFENDYKIELSSIKIKSDARSQGHGTAIIKKLQEYAKKVNKPIVLHPEPESRKKAALHNFYKNLGFKPNKGRRMDYRLSGLGQNNWIWRPRQEIY